MRDSAGRHLPKGEWWVYRFYGSQTGLVSSVTPSPAYDAFATKATGVAKVLVGVNQQTGKCLDVNGVSTADGAAVQQWTCTGGTNQQFTLRRVAYSGNDPHDHQLVARHSGKCVDVSAISTAPGAPVHQ